jgi:ribosomal protein S27E
MILPWLFYLAVCAGIGYLAHTYGRSKFAWFCLSFFFTPLVAFIFLLIAGIPAGAEELEKQIFEEVEHDIQENEKFDYAESETRCPSCGASININTGKGIIVTDEEAPWDIRCESCGKSISADHIEPNS